jgi:hypothetical protein
MRDEHLIQGRGAILLLATLLGLSPAAALAEETLLETLGKASGLIARPANPPDFVKESRPAEAAGEIPVFTPPEEPRSKVKTTAELKAMDADLEGAAGAGKSSPQPARRGHRKSRPEAARAN